MINTGKILLKFIASLLLVKNKELFVKKYGLIGIRFILYIYSILPWKNNSFLFKISGSDKYDQYYDLYNILTSLKNQDQKLNILEIGIGGHDKNYSGGNSLIALEFIFKKSNIIGFDYEDKSFLKNKRTFIYKGDQSKVIDLKKITEDWETLDVIIDDGSHFVDHQLASFEYLFNFLNEGGVYIIEDVQGSYAKCMNGDPELDKSKNLVTYFSNYTHCTNHKFIIEKFKDKYVKYFNFEKILFVENAILIQKKKNSKLSEKFSEDELYLTLDEMNIKKNRIKDKIGIIKQGI